MNFSLSVSVTYNEATRLNVVNPTAARISRATLILSPFYVFNYIVDVKKEYSEVPSMLKGLAYSML
jgi:hypothetical protein